ncbi:MAG: glycosyltransferase family 2 protein, partial [Mobilitalea sp.]
MQLITQVEKNISKSQIKRPEVSVLMSCYNASRWLSEAVDSILRQTFENFEFILIDDGSTDNTWEIIQKYRAQDKRIIALLKKNTGLADSLNIGLNEAKGEWVARLDADDISLPERLFEQFKFVQKNNKVGLLGAGC